MNQSDWAKYKWWKGLLVVLLLTSFGLYGSGHVDLFSGTAFFVMALCIVSIWDAESI